MEFNDCFLARISFILCFTGIFLILILSSLNEPKKIDLSEVSSERIGERVLLKGFVKSSFLIKGVLIFWLEGKENKVKAVIFSPTKKELDSLRKGALVEVIGVIKKYRGELEIEVEKARVLS
jgi:aspartyl/asparaginyl-tRNA synthetase